MKKPRTLIHTILITTLLLFTAGCATQAKAPAKAAESAADASLVWQISVEASEITDSISSTQAVVAYGGDVSQVSHSDAPSEGTVYLLVLLNIDKSQAGKDKFLWSDLSVTDADGNVYSRMANDTFLETHGLPRVKATDLSIGNNHGYVCFEIPATLDASKLTLVYSAEGSAQQIALSPSKSK